MSKFTPERVTWQYDGGKSTEKYKQTDVTDMVKGENLAAK